MNEREIKIVETALQLFSHYGVKKTTMSEIATAAGVARQTLYNAYDCKEQLIYDAVEHHVRKSARLISKECSELDDLGARLDVAFRHLSAKPCEMMLQMPHGEEILQIVEGIDKNKKRNIVRICNQAIGSVLEPFRDRLALGSVDFDDLCEFIRMSFDQIRTKTEEKEQIDRSYAPLRKLLENSVQA
ncbi:TetR/AcrR family transcriptional regulator [uncultured Roseibium sp.]|uniref:TetR/AcrR family transcriptional regulator n=1 Tax=uncultured Roseibium sp. TaxID=1936171 RepID=UPI002606DD21|nr:TetR/AcrR family transcriptional regulator [uncultured Roseibium sp.]